MYTVSNPYAILFSMDLPKELFIPLAAGFVAQLLKIVVEAFRSGEINLRLINAYGGMPSSHTSLVVSLTTVIGIVEGIASPAFSIAAIFSLITVRDAIGVRRYLSEHAHILNTIISEEPKRERPKFPKHLLERIGHTPLQAFMGAIVGLATTFILWVILP